MIADLLFRYWPAGPLLARCRWWSARLGSIGRWQLEDMLRGATLSATLVGIGLALLHIDWSLPVDWRLPGGMGGVIGLVVAGPLDWAIGLSGEPTFSFWAGRAIGLIAVLAGLWFWWRTLDFTLPERGLRMPSLKGPGRTELLAAPEPKELPQAGLPLQAREPRKLVVPDNRPAPVIADRGISPAPAKTKPPTQSSLDFKDSYKCRRSSAAPARKPDRRSQARWSARRLLERGSTTQLKADRESDRPVGTSTNRAGAGTGQRVSSCENRPAMSAIPRASDHPGRP